jgi:hypothetical protein
VKGEGALTMPSHFENLLLTTAHEGASASLGVHPINRTDDIDQLMDAWYRERQERIEVGLFLDEARQLLRRMIIDGEITASSRRKVRRLLLAIESSKREPRDEGTS